MNLSQRCTVLEQIALRTSYDPVTTAFGDKIASEILLYSNKSEQLAPIHIVSVLDSLIKIETMLSKNDQSQ